VYNREGNLGKAQELWRKNLRNDPDNPVLWINMGLAAEREGEYEKALEYYEKARRLRPGDKGLMINIGNAYMALERNRQAHEAYASALGSSKKEIAAYNIFVLALKERKHERAREMNELLRKHFPRSLYARRAEGELALWDGDTARALRTLEGLEKKNDNDWYTLARIYVAKGRKSEARRAMDQLPGDPVWVRMRRELEAQQAFTTADFGTAYEIWNSMADTSLSIQYNMALAALKDRQYKTAMALGQKLVRRADGSIRSDLCRLIGNAAFGLKQWDEARSWYMQLAGLKSDDPLVQYNLAVAAYNLGAIEEAWEHYQRARELDERITNRDIEKRYRALKQGSAATTRIEPIDSLYNVAVELQNSGSDTAAEALYHSIIQKDSTYHLAWNNLGALLAARGDLEQALDCYRKAVERNYGLVEGYANLVNIYMAMGDFSQARRWLLKGKGHNPDSDLLKEMEKHLSDSAEQHSQQQR
jgi:tetratricopeptide (TPR) repeat protein